MPMNKRSKLVVGNWKMNGSRASSRVLVEGIQAGLEEVSDRVDAAVCPPFVYMPLVLELCAESRIQAVSYTHLTLPTIYSV